MFLLLLDQSLSSDNKKEKIFNIKLLFFSTNPNKIYSKMKKEVQTIQAVKPNFLLWGKAK